MKGVLSPVVTPFKADLSPDPERFIRQCRWLLSQDVGLAVFGTNSEANSLSTEEKVELLDRLVGAGVDPGRMMPGTGCCALTDSVRLTAHAMKLGCGGVLMLPPFYYKGVSDDGLFRNFAEVIERVGDRRLRIYLYHIPPVSQVPITVGLIERLLKAYPGIVAGAKDSSGDWNNTQAYLVNFASQGFDVFAGSETFLLQNMRNGQHQSRPHRQALRHLERGGCRSAAGQARPDPRHRLALSDDPGPQGHHRAPWRRCIMGNGAAAAGCPHARATGVAGQGAGRGRLHHARPQGLGSQELGGPMITLTVNGKRRQVDAPPDMPLLWAIREKLNLTGTKFGCGVAVCGACTVLVDGSPVRSCVTTTGAVAGKKITTIEGLSAKNDHPVQKAWIELDVPQCGYCQSGQILSAAALLAQKATPTDTDIDDAMAGNICRCGTYQRIRAGIHRAAQIKKGGA